MVNIDVSKKKTLSMTTLIEGVSNTSLNFRFVIEVNNIEYGFKAKLIKDEVKIEIPIIEDIIRDIQEGTYKAKLEVSSINEDTSGFYMRPWSGDVVFKRTPKVETVFEEEVANENTRPKISMGVIKEESVVEDNKPITKLPKNKKSTRFSKIMSGE